MTDAVYEVKTDLDPQGISAVGLAIFAMWVDFAMGERTLGGRSLAYPSGRYAASIQYRQEGEATVAIMADPAIAPEASILETGHVSIDLKRKLMTGRAYPMHRPVGANPFGTRRIGAGPASMRPRMWAKLRQATASGYASIGPNSAPDSWIIPPMAAYSPALLLSRIAKQMAGGPG